jgi:rubrerythrin
MAIGKESQLIDTLRHLIALDFDTIVAYQAALDRIESARYKRALQEFLTDHWRHTQELTPLVQELGGIAPSHADAKSILIKGKVLIGQLGGDRGLLAAMHSNEDDTNSAYENACARLDLPPHVREILQRARADERRHRMWIARVLGRNQQTTGARLHIPLGAS